MTRQELAQELSAHSIPAELAWALLDDDTDEAWEEGDLAELFSWGEGGDAEGALE